MLLSLTVDNGKLRMGTRLCQPCELLTLLCFSMALATAAEATQSGPRETCRSAECVTLAAGIASMVNQSADPCEDFYNYACGNFPNVAHYNPGNIGLYRDIEESLSVESISQMEERVERKIFELLAVDRLAVDSDPDIQDLYNLTRRFFRSCTDWMRASYFYSPSFDASVSFLKGIFDHLIQGIEPQSRIDNVQFEEILAATVRAGGDSIIYVRLNSALARSRAFRSDLTNVTKAFIEYHPRDWAIPKNEKEESWSFGKYVRFVKSNKVTRYLDLDNAGQSFTHIASNISLSEARMNEVLASKCSITTEPRPYTLRELDELSECAYPNSSFSWQLFFDQLLQSPVDPEALVELADIHLTLTAVNYLKAQPVYSAGDASTERKFSKYASYVIFDWLMSFADFLPMDLRQSAEREVLSMYDKEYLTMRPKFDRITGCMSLTKVYMQPILERMYRVAYHPRGFRQVNDLIHLVKKASIDSVRRQSWIKESGREAIVEKIKWVRHNAGFSQLTRKQLKEFYNITLATFRTVNSSLERTESGFGTLMSVVLCAYSRKNFELMGGSSPVTVFMLVNPLRVNAYNYLKNNRIIFPMAILEPLVYHSSYPDYVNLGSLGHIIGHEIGHSFDDTGHELNRIGAVGHFWDNETEEAFLERLECVRSSYGNLPAYPGGPRYNSNGTLGNDVADIMGLKAAFDALQMLKRSKGDAMQNLPNLQLGLSHDQLFFVRAAQNWCVKVEKSTQDRMASFQWMRHSPNQPRVLGMMQNSWEFARTFQCRSGQGMHPMPQKCTFW